MLHPYLQHSQEASLPGLYCVEALLLRKATHASMPMEALLLRKATHVPMPMEALLLRKATQAPLLTGKHSESLRSSEWSCSWMDFFDISFVVDMSDVAICFLTSMVLILIHQTAAYLFQ